MKLVALTECNKSTWCMSIWCRHVDLAANKTPYTFWLPLLCNNMYTHRSRINSNHQSDIIRHCSINGQKCTVSPVCPIEPPFVDCYTKRVNNKFICHQHTICSIHIWSLYFIQLCICPIQLLILVVNREIIWPDQTWIVQSCSGRPIHGGSLYPGLWTPFSPVHPPTYSEVKCRLFEQSG